LQRRICLDRHRDDGAGLAEGVREEGEAGDDGADDPAVDGVSTRRATAW
jgi:hypothetical protein